MSQAYNTKHYRHLADSADYQAFQPDTDRVGVTDVTHDGWVLLVPLGALIAAGLVALVLA